MSAFYPFRGGVQSGHCPLFLLFFLYDGFPKTEFQSTEDERGMKSERTSLCSDEKDFSHLNSDVAKKLAFLKKEECGEVGGMVWDCHICLSLFILHLRLTHDIYHESPRCLLSNIREDL